MVFSLAAAQLAAGESAVLRFGYFGDFNLHQRALKLSSIVVFVRHSCDFAKNTLMLISRHWATLLVPLCEPWSQIHNSYFLFVFAGTEFGTFRTNKPPSQFVYIFPIPRSATTLLTLGVQRQLCILSQLWDAECCLSCFVFTASSMHFAWDGK